ncbi:hypothetical protein GQ42DRAFT_20394 [Ramicandelaber brevisporus]|nr:hypothetical protein GQ42DRAFT_20394 [Ramicandelaber brevisporus]
MAISVLVCIVFFVPHSLHIFLVNCLTTMREILAVALCYLALAIVVALDVDLYAYSRLNSSQPVIGTCTGLKLRRASRSYPRVMGAMPCLSDCPESKCNDGVCNIVCNDYLGCGVKNACSIGTFVDACQADGGNFSFLQLPSCREAVFDNGALCERVDGMPPGCQVEAGLPEDPPQSLKCKSVSCQNSMKTSFGELELPYEQPCAPTTCIEAFYTCDKYGAKFDFNSCSATYDTFGNFATSTNHSAIGTCDSARLTLRNEWNCTADRCEVSSISINCGDPASVNAAARMEATSGCQKHGGRFKAFAGNQTGVCPPIGTWCECVIPILTSSYCGQCSSFMRLLGCKDVPKYCRKASSA